jgi:hypothetical protein
MWNEVRLCGLGGGVHTVKREGEGLVMFSKGNTGREL